MSAPVATVFQLRLAARYDDGFVAYLNGVEVARRGLVGGSISADSLAAPHPAGAFEAIDLGAHVPLLVPGRNLLATELHQDRPDDDQLVWEAELGYAVRASLTSPGLIVAEWRPADGPRLVITSVPGSVCTLLASTNLAQWHEGVELTVPAGTMEYWDRAATNGVPRFHRAVAR